MVKYTMMPEKGKNMSDEQYKEIVVAHELLQNFLDKVEIKECEVSCGLNHCDTNGCNNSERYLVDVSGDVDG